MRRFRIISGGLIFAIFTMGFAMGAFLVTPAHSEEYKLLPGFGENTKPIPKPTFRPKVTK